MNTEKKRNTILPASRLRLFYGVIILLSVYYIFRLFNIIIVDGAANVVRAEDNRTDTTNVPAQRGIIYDRNGVVLAQNVASYNLVITPADLPGDPEDSTDPGEGSLQEIYRQLSALVGIPVNHGTTDKQTVRSFSPCQTDLGIAQIVYIGVTNWPYKPVRVKCNIDEKTAMEIKEKSSDWPGVGIEVVPIRDYPTGELTSDIIGFLGPLPQGQENNPCYKEAGLDKNRDKVGYAGVEESLQCDLANDPLLPGNSNRPLLSGINGQVQSERDVAGKQVGSIGSPIDAQPGKNIELTIDTRLQYAAESSIKSWFTYWHNTSSALNFTNGVVIAINPKTGEILAMVSYPTYENNRFARIIPGDYYNQLKNDPHKPLFNQAISAEVAPGSTFKLAPSLGILNEGVVTPDQKIEDPGKIYLNITYDGVDTGREQAFQCWIYPTTNAGHGLVDFLTGLAQSCDVYFYKVGGGYQNEVPNGGLNIYRLGEYAKALGYDHATGVELPGEATGLIPDPTWKRRVLAEAWSTGDTYIGTIGQGYVLATPIQVLMSAATMANNGIYMKPTIVKDILDTDGHVIRPFQAKQEWDITKDPKVAVFTSDWQTVRIMDAQGNPIQEKDENGDLKVDLFGDPVYDVQRKTIAPWVVKEVQEGMRKVVVDGTAASIFKDMENTIHTAGKTGTAEYCDDIANKAGQCQPGHWPAHAWYVGYAPYEDPEIAVVAFVYGGKEGSTVAAPIVQDVIQSYFDLKKIDKNPNNP